MTTSKPFRRSPAISAATDIVRFRPGGVPLKDLPSELEAMDLGLVGNRRTEAGELMLPVKLLEYVFLGIPAVAPRLKTITRYFSEDMVTFYDPGDVESLVEAIGALSCDPELRRARADRAGAVMAMYAWEVQGNELVGFYRRLLGRRDPEQPSALPRAERPFEERPASRRAQV